MSEYVCVWASIEQSERAGKWASGHGKITCSLWRPARAQSAGAGCVFAKWNRECVCVHAVQNKSACVWVGSHAALCTQQLPPLPLCKLSTETAWVFLQGNSVHLQQPGMWTGGRWRSLLAAAKSHDFKMVGSKSRPLYCIQGGLGFSLQ